MKGHGNCWEVEVGAGGGGVERGQVEDYQVEEYQVEDYVVTFSGFYIRFSWKDFVKFDRENEDIVHVNAWYSFSNFSQSQLQFHFLKLFRAKLSFRMPTSRNHILHSFMMCSVDGVFLVACIEWNRLEITMFWQPIQTASWIWRPLITGFICFHFLHFLVRDAPFSAKCAYQFVPRKPSVFDSALMESKENFGTSRLTPL